MQKSTKWGTSTYHLTIYWVEQNLSFNQSPTCHIPSMNMGLTTNQRGLPRDLLYIPPLLVNGFLGPKPSSIQPSFNMYPTIIVQGIPKTKKETYTTRIYLNLIITNQGMSRPKQEWMPLYVFIDTLMNFPISTLKIYCVSHYY